MNKKPIFVKKISKIKENEQQIIMSKKDIKGQKNKEFFYQKNEKLEIFKGDPRIKKIQLYKNHNLKISKKIFDKTKSIDDFLKIFNKLYLLKKNLV